MKKRIALVFLSVMSLFLLVSCGKSKKAKLAVPEDSNYLALAQQLADAFYEDTSLTIEIQKVKEKDVDRLIENGKFQNALFVGSEKIDKKIEAGHYKGQLAFYASDYLIGHKSDPCGVGQLAGREMRDVFRHIAMTDSVFVYMPVLSTTAIREQLLWEDCSEMPKEDRYIALSDTNIATLFEAIKEHKGYALVSKVAYDNAEKSDDITIFYSGKGELMDGYYLLSSVKESADENSVSNRFITWLREDRAREIISNYVIENGLAPLYTPALEKIAEEAE